MGSSSCGIGAGSPNRCPEMRSRIGETTGAATVAMPSTIKREITSGRLRNHFIEVDRDRYLRQPNQEHKPGRSDDDDTESHL
jgi:hypothetical protein